MYMLFSSVTAQVSNFVSVQPHPMDALEVDTNLDNVTKDPPLRLAGSAGEEKVEVD
jgi:hypothetical protein